VYCDVSVSSVAANAEQQLLLECVCECEKRGRTNSTRASGCVSIVCVLVSISIVFGKILFGWFCQRVRTLLLT